MSTRPLISVVDDDESARESLPDLLKEFGFNAQAFSSAEEFLDSESGVVREHAAFRGCMSIVPWYQFQPYDTKVSDRYFGVIDSPYLLVVYSRNAKSACV